MSDPTYKVIEIVGTSEQSVTHAIDNAVQKAAETIRHLSWFETIQVRGSVADGRVGRYQVTLKAGFAME